MRLPFCFAIVVTASACVPTRAVRHANADAQLGAALVVGGALLVAHAADDAKEPTSPPPSVGEATPVVVLPHRVEFDRTAAKMALRAVEYRDCGQGGPARVVLVFSSKGKVVRAGIVESKLAPEVESCVLHRFQAVRVPPFTAEQHAVSWGVWLPVPLAAEPPPAGSDDEIPRGEEPLPM